MIVIENILDVFKHLEGLKVIVFDLDDTLYSEKDYVRSGYQAIYRGYGRIKDLDKKLWTAFEAKKPAIDQVLKDEGYYSEELKQRLLEIYRSHLPNISLYAGVEKMLVDLKNQGYKLGLITDGRPEGQRAKIRALKLDNYIDKIIITDELGGVEYRKPNQTAFVKMKELFDVKFSEMCYVGDNVSKDFVAPDKLGIKQIYFCNLDGLYSNKNF